MRKNTNFVSPYLRALQTMEASEQVPPGTLKKVMELGKEMREQKLADPVHQAKKARKGKYAKRPFTQAEVNEYFKLTRAHFERNGRYRPLLFFAIGIHTGLRLTDILSVTWENLLEGDSQLTSTHLKDDFFLIVEKKTQKKRTIYINPELRSIIDYIYKSRARKTKRTGYVFQSPKFGGPVKEQSQREKFYEFIYMMGLDNVRDKIGVHSLRKTFAWNMFRSLGGTENAKEIVRQVLGHSSIEVTDVYLGMDKNTLRDAYLALNYQPRSLYDITV